MSNQAEIYQQELLREIKAIPPEYVPNLLKIIRLFRETALFGRVSRNKTEEIKDKCPLRGLPFTYVDPTEPIAVDDWEVLQ
jgi:hypothetical protein